MTRKSVVGKHAICLAALAWACLCAGCARPTAPVEQFVGTWVTVPKPGAQPAEPNQVATTVLLPDGTGTSINPPNPHIQYLNWFLKGDKLVLVDRDSRAAITYRYRFSNPNELVLTGEGKDHIMVRAPVPIPSSPARR